MKKTVQSLGGGVLASLLFFCISCGSLPEGPVPPELSREKPDPGAITDPEETPEAPLAAAEETIPEAAAEMVAEIPSEVIPVRPRISEPPEYGNLPEPEADLAEVHWPDPVPREEERLETLPEPVLLTLLPEPAPAAEPPPPLGPSPALEPPPVIPPTAAPVPVPEPPPDPPRNLRPVEALTVPPPARENPPVPVNPIPDLPPRIPQSVLQFPGETEGEPAFSRVVRVMVGQLVEIPFRGTGWVFLGELEARRGIAYGSRRLDSEGQSFIFRAEEAGAYALKFYKQDFIRDYILNDYVQVIIGETPESPDAPHFTLPTDRGRVIAEPRWPPLPETASGPGQTAGSAERLPVGTVPQGDPRPVDPAPAPEQGTPPAAQGPSGPATPEQGPGSSAVVQDPSGPLSPERYTNQAREAYDAGRIPQALSILDQFREIYPVGNDEAWWLYGQLLEANSPRRDIRSALDYYRRLVREYPQSPRFDEARRRIAYLERYYFNIQ